MQSPHSYYYTTRTISKIFYELNKKLINPHPIYQRDIVWSKDKQADVIRTLFDDYPIPPLNFVKNDFSPDSISDFVYECMDGKNRLESIYKYMTNDLDVDGFYSELTDDEKYKFENIEVQICIFLNMSDYERRDYYRRIQNGVTLNKCEIIWSYDHHSFIQNLKIYRAANITTLQKMWNTKRYTDLQLICNLAAIIMNLNCKHANASHSTYMIHWVEKQDYSMDYTEVFEKIHKTILYVSTIADNIDRIDRKFRQPIMLDLCRLYIYNNYVEFSPNVYNHIMTFIKNVASMKLDNDFTDVDTNGNQYKYYELIHWSATSAQYSNIQIMNRFPLFKNISHL